MPDSVIRSVKIQSPETQTSIKAPIGALGTNVILSTDSTRNIEATFDGATNAAAGKKGLVPAPALGETEKYLKSDGTWGNPAGGVTGVKGDAEIDYRNGNVNLTAANIGAIATSQIGVASGVAELDANGKVPSAQLPSFVDDVIEGYYYNDKFYEDAAHTEEIAGEASKIYVDLTTNKTYRWSGSAYVEISESLALGETSTTAYRGDRGKIAYDHSQSTHTSISVSGDTIVVVS